MTVGYGFRNILLSGTRNGEQAQLSRHYRSVLATGREGIIVNNRFYVQQTDGTADGPVDTDSTNSATPRKYWGLCAKIFNTMGQELNVPYLGLTTAGLVQGFEDLSNYIFVGVADGAATWTPGVTFGIAHGTITDGPGSRQADESFTPEPDSNDKIDASVTHATDYAVIIDGYDPDIRNDVTAARVLLFHLKASLCVA